jgi:SPP1 gp7 family putative phage head morphogenesis protein
MKDRSKTMTAKSWKDPTRSLSRLAKVESQLVALFRNYRRRVLAELKPAEQPFTQMEQLTQKWPESFSIEHFYQRLEDLTTQELIGPATAILEKEIPDAFTHGTKYADLNLKAKMGIKLGAPLEERQRAWQKVGALVEKSKGEFKGVSDAVNQQIRRAVADGMVNEDSLSTVTKRIQDVAESVGENRARMIARTETMKAINTGVKDRYTQAGIVRYERLEAEDERTCEYCSSIDGKVFTKEEADEIDANMHPNCRGTWIISEDSLGLEEATQKYRQIIQGGVGSGNFGHAGRPGEVGGSGPGGGIPSAKDSLKFSEVRGDIFPAKDYDTLSDEYSEIVRAGPRVLPEENIRALHYYQSTGYRSINEGLRNPDQHPLDSTDSKAIDKIDATFESHSQSIPQGTELWRGVGNRSGYLVSKLEVGDICNDAAFQSFSLDPHTAGNFARFYPEGRGEEGRLSKTVIRAVMSGEEKAIRGSLVEKEIIFKRGTNWQVISKEVVDPTPDTRFNIVTVMKHG